MRRIQVSTLSLLTCPFFDTVEDNAPKINILAIVGKNSEGRSALVEIIIRP